VDRSEIEFAGPDAVFLSFLGLTSMQSGYISPSFLGSDSIVATSSRRSSRRR